MKDPCAFAVPWALPFFFFFPELFLPPEGSEGVLPVTKLTIRVIGLLAQALTVLSAEEVSAFNFPVFSTFIPNHSKTFWLASEISPLRYPVLSTFTPKKSNNFCFASSSFKSKRPSLSRGMSKNCAILFVASLVSASTLTVVDFFPPLPRLSISCFAFLVLAFTSIVT